MEHRGDGVLRVTFNRIIDSASALDGVYIFSIEGVFGGIPPETRDVVSPGINFIDFDLSVWYNQQSSQAVIKINVNGVRDLNGNEITPGHNNTQFTKP